MAEESQQEVTFATEEEKSTAIDSFDEKSGNADDLERIMNAEIKAPETTEKTTEETTSEEKVSTEEKATEEAADDKTAIQETVEEKPQEPFAVKPEDLPEGMKTPGEAFKAFKEGQDLIVRQGEKIQQLMSQMSQGQQVAKAAETELKDAQRDIGVKEEKAEDTLKIPDSQYSQIAALQEEYSKIEDPFDERAIEINKKLIPLMNQEIMRSSQIANTAIEETGKLKQTVTEYQSRQDESSLAERNKVELKKQLDEMDDFAKMDEYKEEYGMTVSAAEADQKYIDWRNKVAFQYYGSLPSDATQEGRDQLNYAMYMLKQRSPDLIKKLQEAAIPIEPDKDTENYLKLCELLDERDCIRYDPITKKRVQLTRFNPQTGKHEAVSFPSLKATIDHKRAESGYYKDKMLEANKNGAKSMADAITKRDSKELENDTGSVADVQMTDSVAMEALGKFDMDAAYKKYYQNGDESVFDEYNAAMQTLGQPKMDLTNVPTLANKD